MPEKYSVKIINPKEKERMMQGYHAMGLYELKAAIHGTCVKFFTNNPEFKEMWEDNFEPMPDWIRPHARLFAVRDGKRLEVLYEPLSKTAIVKNCDYYGWVKSIGLALVADFMEDFTSEHRRYAVHGSFVDKGGRGIGIVGTSGSGKTTLTYGLLLDSAFSFLTDDWFFVRLADNCIPVFSSEKNSYVRNDLAQTWPQLRAKLKGMKMDSSKRAIVDVKRLFGGERIRKDSTLSLFVILTREKGRPVLQKLGRKEALAFMLKHDFCNPHQLVRSRARLEQRKKFFGELFDKVPVYLLNTVETPKESLERLRGLAKEYIG
ncbi:hypothetical protein H0O02_05265 [Candidatus Micrarchaeota archaeon]|nr:hypothetical protein [Candidatus Micrarchaeota archaeon]